MTRVPTVVVATICMTPDLVPAVTVVYACPMLLVVMGEGEIYSPPFGPLEMVTLNWTACAASIGWPRESLTSQLRSAVSFPPTPRTSIS